MITNNEEKLHVNKQLIRLENALEDIKFKLLPNNPDLFRIMSSNYVEKIKELRKEIDLYIGLEEGNAIKDADLIIRLQGPKIGFGKAPISVVTNILEDVRKSFQDIYSQMVGHKRGKNLPNYIIEACDMSLTSVFEGSLQVALKRPFEQLKLFSATEFERTAELFFTAAQWASKELSEEILEREIPDKDLREITMKSILRITPRGNKKLSSINLYGNLVKENVILTKRSRDFILDKIAKGNEQEKIHTYQGRIREVDLDRSSFKLREIEGSPEITEITGYIQEKLLNDLKDSLDSMALIKGVLRNETCFSKSLNVRFIERIETD